MMLNPMIMEQAQLQALRQKAEQLEFELKILLAEDPLTLEIHRKNSKELDSIYSQISELEAEIEYER